MIRKTATTLAALLMGAAAALGPPQAQAQRTQQAQQQADQRAQTGQRAPLGNVQEIYGAVADPANPGQLLLGSKYGLLRATPDGFVELTGAVDLAVTSLTSLPGGGEMMLSGYSGEGVPAGILRSSDGGANWAALPGTAGPQGVMVASLGINPADPRRLVGLNQTIVLSDDGGQNWRPATSTPDRTFGVAFGAGLPERLFAAGMDGLMVSDDGGANWTRSYPGENPATAIAPLTGGRMIGFVFGDGVILSQDNGANWQLAASGFDGRFLMSFSEGPDGTIYGVADTGAVLMSRDAGATWASFEGSDTATPAQIALGRDLFAANCQVCHGVGGVGEDPATADATEFLAPALNDDMHAWHHSDAGLLATIHKGSPRTPRMIAWEDVLSEAEMTALVAYIKSTWSIPSLVCQGARHMGCARN